MVDIGAYCLMPNHFHLLVRAKDDNGVTIFMKKLLTGYSMYFNKKQNRSGSLFEGTFKASHIDNNEYLKYLFAYIHLNPVKTVDPHNWESKIIIDARFAQQFLDKYEYSSYAYYRDRPRPSDSILSGNKNFPDYFNQAHEFQEFVSDWIEYSTVKDRP